MATKSEQMDAIKARIVSENICPDLAAQATQLVMGEGNLDAKLVLIGEAPGKNEDEQGIPFVGASGKFLNELLAGAGIKREDVYITNIVKYRPPNNRDPSTAEKQAFLPFLLEQLDVIHPEVIITLGRHSMEYFLPDAKISEIHGRPQHATLDGQAVLIMPLYHPAAAIYNRSLRQVLIDDFTRAEEIARNKK